MSTAARFGAAMAMLWASHDLADHVVQTDHQATGKSNDWWCMASHISTYHVTQSCGIAALHALGVRPGWRRVVSGIAVSAVTHAFLDRRWPVTELLRRTGSDRFAAAVINATEVHHAPDATGRSWTRPQALPLHGPYLADQALHHVCLLITAAIMAGDPA